MTPERATAFQRDGHVVLPGAVASDACERMRERVWRALARQNGARSDAPETWQQITPRGFGSLTKSGAFQEMASPPVLAALDALLGSGTWGPPVCWGGPLVTFPHATEWDVPSKHWHLDYPARGRWGRPFAVKLLMLLAPLASRGGCTLLLEGSHHLVQKALDRGEIDGAGHSTDVRKHLARKHRWIRDLVSRRPSTGRVQRFMTEGTTVDGVPLRVVEFSGKTGDVLVFHPWLFHAPSANAARAPRLMLGQNVTTHEGLSIYARPEATAPRRARASRSGAA